MEEAEACLALSVWEGEGGRYQALKEQHPLCAAGFTDRP